MRDRLTPCPSCARHVRSSASACPFCQSPLAAVEAPEVAATGLRLSRAVGFFFGASLAAAGALSLQSCAVYGAPPEPVGIPNDGAADATDAADAADATADAPPADDGSPGVRYGAPPVDP